VTSCGQCFLPRRGREGCDSFGSLVPGAASRTLGLGRSEFTSPRPAAQKRSACGKSKKLKLMQTSCEP
jgi:hypothetical protein